MDRINPTELGALVELLAIRLYEHDHDGWPASGHNVPWMQLADVDRQHYRDIASGTVPYPEPDA